MRDLLVQLAARFQAAQAEEGQTMVEYGLILALVSVVAITILGSVGTGVIGTFTSAAGAL